MDVRIVTEQSWVIEGLQKCQYEWSHLHEYMNDSGHRVDGSIATVVYI